MAGLTKVKGSGLATGAATDSLVGIDDNATSTAITIDASENVTFTGTLNGISTTKSASGNRWGVLPQVESNGVMEVGKYIDFHETDADTSDYGARLEVSGTQLISTHGIYAAAGVYLGGTGAANKLDDYEEGTWDPTLNATSYSPATGKMHYTKIGNVVHIVGTLSIGAISGGSGTIIIGGLPYTSKAITDGYTSLNAHAYQGLNINATTANFQTLRVDPSTTNLKIVAPSGTGSTRVFGDYSHVSGGSFAFRVSGAYLAT